MSMTGWQWTQTDTDELSEMCEKLQNNIPFAFSRWGDGEWIMVSKTYDDKKNANIDGNIYYDDLADKLKQIVSQKQDYYMGHMKMPIADPYGNSLEHMKHEYPQDWKNSDLLHGLSIRNQIPYMLELFQSIHVVYIGNESLKTLPFIDEFIEIPYKNVWDNYDKILSDIKNCIKDDIHKTFLFSAGMATNVFVDDLWKYNKNNTYMDVGSVFDPYVGRRSRGYMNDHKINKLEI
tara:strand:+ start:250 stop:951 length:702 start_codon:yes stop_codon:yes gene_type:complete